MNEESIQHFLENDFGRIYGFVDPALPNFLLRMANNLDLSYGAGEIGCYHGKLFILLRHFCSPSAPSIAIDLFEDQDRNIDGSGGGDPSSHFHNNLGFFDPHKGQNIKIVQGDSTSIETMREITDKYSLFSVDGGHTFRHAYNDILIAERATADGGLILVDDFMRPDWPEVTEAVYKYLSGNPRFVPLAIGWNKLFLCHFTRIDALLTLVASAFPNGKKVELNRFPVWTTRLF